MTNELEKKFPSQEERWLKHYEKYAKENSSVIYDKRLWDVIEERLKMYENVPALKYYGRYISREAFTNMVYSWARTFKFLGVKEGDVVPVLSTYTPSIGAITFALNVIGACPNFVKLNATYDMYDKELENSNCCVFLDALYNEEYKKLLDSDKFNNVVVATVYDDMLLSKKCVVSALSNFKAMINKSSMPKGGKYIWYDQAQKISNYYTGKIKAPFVTNEKALITYSSGTTGKQLKGTVATNESAISQMLQAYYADMGYEEGKVCLAQLPPLASTSINCLFFSPLYAGMEIDMYPIPDYKQYYNQIMESKPHFTISTGAVWKEFFETYLKKGKGKSLEFLHVPVIGGDGATKEEIKWMNDILKNNGAKSKMYSGYGLSECFSVVTFDKPGLDFESDDAKDVATVGIPYPGMTVGVFDENGNELSYNQRGELYVKTNARMLEYYRKPELTEKIFNGDWIKTGDLASIGDNGEVYVYGRLNDKIDDTYLFDIANDAKKYSNGAIISCIVSIVNNNDGNYDLVCNYVSKEELSSKDVYYIMTMLNWYLPKNINVIKMNYYKKFPINAGSIKIDKLQINEENKELIKKLK